MEAYFDKRQQHLFTICDSEEAHDILLKSGAYWEWFPEFDGSYECFVEHKGFWLKLRENNE